MKTSSTSSSTTSSVTMFFVLLPFHCVWLDVCDPLCSSTSGLHHNSEHSLANWNFETVSFIIAPKHWHMQLFQCVVWSIVPHVMCRTVTYWSWVWELIVKCDLWIKARPPARSDGLQLTHQSMVITLPLSLHVVSVRSTIVPLTQSPKGHMGQTFNEWWYFVWTKVWTNHLTLAKLSWHNPVTLKCDFRIILNPFIWKWPRSSEKLHRHNLALLF